MTKALKLGLGGALAASFLALAAAYIAEYAFHMAPCQLCLLQRKPYFAVAALSAGALLLDFRHARVALFICGFLFLADAGIAGYHLGVEYKIFPGPDTCSGAPKPGTSLEELRRQLIEAPLVRCDEPSVILGFSMAGWNMAYATLAAAATLYYAGRRK